MPPSPNWHAIQLPMFAFFCLVAVAGSQHNVRHSSRRLQPGGSALEQNHKIRNSRSPSPAFPSQPYFDTRVHKETGRGARNVTTIEGGGASLACTVENLGTNQTVSWIRKARHPVVLSSGQDIFTSDGRFKILISSRSWKLAIDPVLEKDEGLYECQVNTRGKMSLVFKLNVEPSKAKLRGKSEVYVKRGSTISLTCAINLYTVPPPDIVWLHGSKPLNYDSPRGGISLEIEKTRTGTTSKLLVTRARMSDSGAYTCKPTRGQPAVADVHIITDENPAGLHDGQTSLAVGKAFDHERILMCTAAAAIVWNKLSPVSLSV